MKKPRFNDLEQMDEIFCVKKGNKYIVDEKFLNNMNRVVLTPQEYAVYNKQFPRRDQPMLHYKGHPLVIRTTFKN